MKWRVNGGTSAAGQLVDYYMAMVCRTVCGKKREQKKTNRVIK